MSNKAPSTDPNTASANRTGANLAPGAAWGCMLMSAISAALAIGDSGAEGKMAPVACWSVAGAGLLIIAASRAQQSAARMRPV
jgi:hypothetical protein